MTPSRTSCQATGFAPSCNTRKATATDRSCFLSDAAPSHSWERGTNYNTNGLIPQYLPKGRSMSKPTQSHCAWIADELIKRPRNRHNSKTPQDVFYGL